MLQNPGDGKQDAAPGGEAGPDPVADTLKYTQSNSVCYAKDGQVIGVGAGQQSRIHCTRLAGNKADVWYLRQHPKVLGLQFVDGIRRADRDNTIDVYISVEYEDVLADGVWQTLFAVKPEPLTAQEKKEWLATQSGVSLGSDAFFPFGDNIERARKSGVAYIAEPGGSIRDDHVIDTCNKYGMAMAFTGSACSIIDSRRDDNGYFGGGRRRPRARDCPQAEGKSPLWDALLCARKRGDIPRRGVLRCGGHRY